MTVIRQTSESLMGIIERRMQNYNIRTRAVSSVSCVSGVVLCAAVPKKKENLSSQPCGWGSLDNLQPMTRGWSTRLTEVSILCLPAAGDCLGIRRCKDGDVDRCRRCRLLGVMYGDGGSIYTQLTRLSRLESLSIGRAAKLKSCSDTKFDFRLVSHVIWLRRCHGQMDTECLRIVYSGCKQIAQGEIHA